MSTHKKPRAILHVNPGKIQAPAASGNPAAPPTPRNAAEERAERIAVAAYFIAEKRNFRPGSEFNDWLAAEREIDAPPTAARNATGHR